MLLFHRGLRRCLVLSLVAISRVDSNFFDCPTFVSYRCFFTIATNNVRNKGPRYPWPFHMGDSFESPDNFMEPPEKAKRGKRKASRTMPDTLPREADSVNEVQPVILQSLTEKKLATYSPIAIDRCLSKCVGAYRSCIPLKNGNLMVKVETTLQVKGLLALAYLSDGSGVSIPILTSLLQPANAKGVIYRVPVDLSTEELKAKFSLSKY